MIREIPRPMDGNYCVKYLLSSINELEQCLKCLSGNKLTLELDNRFCYQKRKTWRKKNVQPVPMWRANDKFDL